MSMNGIFLILSCNKYVGFLGKGTLDVPSSVGVRGIF
jgi:hypothetical protein